MFGESKTNQLVCLHAGRTRPPKWLLSTVGCRGDSPETMSVSQLIDAVNVRRSAFEHEAQRLRDERAAHEKDADALEAQRKRNGEEMAGYLLPDLDDEDLIDLEKRLRYPVLIAEKRKTEVALAELEVERTRLEANPRYAQREVMRIDCEQQLAEIADAAQAFATEREIWEKSEYFQALFKRGWFADDYDGGLFDWLRDWRACSLLMAELEAGYRAAATAAEGDPTGSGGREFLEDEDVKAAWNTLFANSEPVLKLQQSLVASLAVMTRLEKRHAELLAAPDAMFQALWRRLADLVIEHLRAVDQELLLALAKQDEALATFLKKDAGLKKQAVYLRQLIVARINPQIARFETEVQKLGKKHEKLRYKRARGKYIAAEASDIAAMRSVPAAKWDARRSSFARTRARVTTFDNWDRGSFVSDYLWWDLVTRGARGDDLYEVRSFHERHPGWSAATFVDPLDRSDRDLAADANDLAASSTVDSMLADDGLHDAS